ncbi:MAG TPA: hypothetical protein VLK59_14730 [Solirubrobacteraceae bacterium]|nr:hypothetical protein [Solirubrobacteraceae bacterium]
MRIPNPFNRKSALERLLQTLDASLGAAGDLPSSLPRRIGADKAKAGLIAAGGLASLTAASAGISSLRRRLESPQGDS